MSITNQKGDVGELAVATKLLELGYRVSIPFGHDSPYDLVVEVDGELKKVQIKTTDLKDGVLAVRCSRVTTTSHGKIVRQSYTSDDFDIMIVYDTTSRRCFNIPIELVNETADELSLRVDPTKNGQKKGIRWAKDYLLEGL